MFHALRKIVAFNSHRYDRLEEVRAEVLFQPARWGWWWRSETCQDTETASSPLLLLSLQVEIDIVVVISDSSTVRGNPFNRRTLRLSLSPAIGEPRAGYCEES